MSEHDEDLRTMFRTVADGAEQRAGAEGQLLAAARRRRLITASAATLSLLLLIGGIAGASLLWQPEKSTPAPPALSDCEESPYDVAVFVEDSASEEEIETLRTDLLDDGEVEGVIFFSKEDAFEEFKEHYEDQPEFWENLPEDALPMSFRVSLVDGADTGAAARRFKRLPSVEDVRTYEQMDDSEQPTPDCAGEQKRFARYFFETGSRDASASGVLEVNSQDGTVCYEATTENIQASHLLRNTGVVAGGRRFERMIVVTFFDPNDREQGSASPSGAPICFQEEQLGELEGGPQVLIDHPEDFRVDFHRGPNDDPGLVAELRASPNEGGRADFYIEDDPGFGVHVPGGWQVARRSLTPNLDDPREILSLGTAPMPSGGSCAQQPVRALDALGPKDAFISIQERRGDAGHPPRPRSFRERLEDRLFNIELCTDADDFRPYLFAFRDAGRDFHLLAALGTKASSQRTREFWEVLDSLDFEPPYDDNRR